MYEIYCFIYRLKYGQITENVSLQEKIVICPAEKFYIDGIFFKTIKNFYKKNNFFTVSKAISKVHKVNFKYIFVQKLCQF